MMKLSKNKRIKSLGNGNVHDMHQIAQLGQDILLRVKLYMAYLFLTFATPSDALTQSYYVR